jgi:hypothetical protein
VFCYRWHGHLSEPYYTDLVVYCRLLFESTVSDALDIAIDMYSNKVHIPEAMTAAHSDTARNQMLQVSFEKALDRYNILNKHGLFFISGPLVRIGGMDVSLSLSSSGR